MLSIQNEKEKINYLIEKLIKNKFLDKKSANLSVATVVSACMESFEGTIGKIIVFSSSIPKIGYGKLKWREDPKIMNSDLEK